MYASHSLFVFFALLVLASANPIARPPVPVTKSNKSSSLDIERTVLKFQMGTTTDNTGVAHLLPDVIKTSTKRANYAFFPLVELRDDYDNTYRWGVVCYIGTPPQKVFLIVDTGSSSLTLLPNCDDENCVNDNGFYHPTESSTMETGNGPFILTYNGQDGIEVWGYRDSVTIAGLTAKDQVLAVATKATNLFDEAAGILGLAFPQSSAMNAVPFIQTLIDQRTLSSQLFSLRLSDSANSEMTIGGVNPHPGDGVMIWLPRLYKERGLWMVPMKGVTIGGVVVPGSEGRIVATLDSGCPVIKGPGPIVTRLHRLIGGFAKDPNNPYKFIVPCNTRAILAFYFEGTIITIPPSIYILYNSEIPTAPHLCDSGIFALPANYPGPTQFILGAVFMLRAVTAYDIGRNLVGIASVRDQ